MSLEQLLKSAREFESFDSFFAGLSPEKEKECIDHYEKYLIEFAENLTKQAYLQGIRDAKGCVPEEKELLPYPGDRRGGIENQMLSQENNLKAGFNKARTSTLEAITRLEETV